MVIQIKNIMSYHTQARPRFTSSSDSRGPQIPQHHEVHGANYLYRRFLDPDTNPKLLEGEIGTFRNKDELIAEVDRIDKEFEALPGLAKKHIFYRGLYEMDYVSTRHKGIEILTNAKVGDIVTPDSAYAYTSYNERSAISWAKYGDRRRMVLEIHTPKGAKISCNLEHGGEGLFPRNAQYKILEKRIGPDGISWVKLQYILPNNKQKPFKSYLENLFNI